MKGKNMQKNIINEIINNIEKYNEKRVVLNQLGFIDSKFVFDNLTYSVENDILTIRDEKNDIFIKMNLNQVYDLKTNENTILIYLDNDTQIKISK